MLVAAGAGEVASVPIDTFCGADYYYIDDVLLAVSVLSGATRLQDVAGGVMTEDKVVALLARFSEDLPSGAHCARHPTICSII